MKRTGLTGVVSFAAVLLMAALTMASGVRTVDVDDRCDPDTFNAALGDGTCIGDGNVTFAEFLDQLNPQDNGHDAWRLNFGRGEIDPGETLRAENRGGEFHTFTEVVRYGGGCIAEVNGPLGLTPVQECDALTQVAPGVFVPTAFLQTGVDAGGRRDVKGLRRGTPTSSSA